MKRKTFDVVGLKHYGTNALLKEIETQVSHAPLKVRLKREPNNPADPNAIAVVISDKGNVLHGKQIGHLRRIVAKEMAPKMDDGSLKVKGAVLTDVDVGDGEAEVEIGLNKGKIDP